MPTKQHGIVGPKGRIETFIKGNRRCPADDFFSTCTEDFQNRFRGSFDAIVRQGSAFCNGQRFKPLQGVGKPLWEFKEHDHRLYCVREVGADGFVRIVLLDGWVKDKKGKNREERNAITRAKNLCAEYVGERKLRP